MVDFLAFIIFLFLFGFVVLIIIIGIRFFHSLFMAGQLNENSKQETNNQIDEDSKEDSEADLAMTTDDENSWMFPPESE